MMPISEKSVKFDDNPDGESPSDGLRGLVGDMKESSLSPKTHEPDRSSSSGPFKRCAELDAAEKLAFQREQFIWVPYAHSHPRNPILGDIAKWQDTISQFSNFLSAALKERYNPQEQ